MTILSLCCFLQVISTQTDVVRPQLETDARLKVPVTVRAKILLLGDFCDQLSKATGVSFEVEKAISDRKITAFFHDRPVSEAMWALHQALQMDWVQGKKNGYRLTLSDSTRVDERDIHAVEDEIAVASIRKILGAFTKMSDLTEGQRIARLRTLAGGSTSATSDPATELSPEVEREMIGWAELGSALSGHEPDIAKTLSTGNIVYSSTQSNPGFYRLPPKFMAAHISYWNDEKYVNPTDSISTLRYLADQHKLEGRVFFVAIGDRICTERPLNLDLLARDDAALEKEPLLKHLNKWAQVSDPKVLKSPFSGKTPSLPPGHETGIYSKELYSVADQLAELSEVSDVPIIADAFRVPCSSVPGFNGQTLVEWLANFNQDRDKPPIGYQQGYVRTENGWLMYRHAHYWRLLDREPPEHLVAALESKNAAHLLTFGDYVDLAGQLTDAQLDSFTSSRATLVNFRTEALLQGGDMLALWASLSPSERDLAATVGFRLGEALTPDQIHRCERAWYKVLSRIPLRESQLDLFLPNKRRFSQVRFFASLSNNPVVDRSFDPAATVDKPTTKLQFAYLGFGNSPVDQVKTAFTVGRVK